ncbi:FMN-dependent NADH-azoreductase [Shewanella salipaludis]|uniref:FMN dependent NADH:quinone oxidoreductase n=1 Tax=Shewanella salipaludis TaxID=2723052 RepID=A0A972G0J6_9GAMM|nr:NAD(P)H-dependent oxidoreductase [Shewanella salipaludis]NMH66598.1 FMN-dependent NADH-azoreductase [Shewanella salipaludis]
MKLLHLTVSPNLEGSSSRKVAARLLARLADSYPRLEETLLDLSQQPLPHLDELTTSAFLTPVAQRTPAQQQAVQLSDLMVDMLLDCELLLLSSPMWNLGLPSVLKAWFDHITRAGRTFGFTDQGTKVGLVPNKKVYLVVSSGGVFSSGPWAQDDCFTPYVRKALAYIGITDLTVIRVDGTHDPLTRDTALQNALQAVDSLHL